jgi:WD40 repeat protein
VLIASCGALVFSGSNDGTLRTWNTRSGQCVHIFRARSKIYCLARVSEATVVGGGVGSHYFLDANTGVLLSRWDHKSWGWISFIEVHEHEDLAVSTSDSTVTVWCKSTGTVLHERDFNGASVYSVHWVDGRTILCGCHDGVVYRWRF